MAILSGIAVGIVTGEEALQDFGNPNTKDEPGIATRYIGISSGAEWKVYIRVPAAHKFKSEVLVVKVSLNKDTVAEVWLSPKKAGRSQLPHTDAEGAQDPPAESDLNDMGFITPFADPKAQQPVKFPSLVSNKCEKDAGQDDIEAWEKEEIVVQVSHGKLVDDVMGTVFGRPGCAEGYRAEPVGGPQDILTFKFLPRPWTILKAICGVPLPEPPRQGSVLWSKDVKNLQAHPADLRWRQTVQNSNNSLYCYCQKVNGLPAITCENDRCRIQTFHLRCVGLKQREAPWFCPECREMPREKMRCRGKTATC